MLFSYCCHHFFNALLFFIFIGEGVIIIKSTSKLSFIVNSANIFLKLKFYVEFAFIIVVPTKKDILYEEFEDTKGVIRIRKSKDRQHNGQKKKDKRTNNDLHNITHKTKDQVTLTPLKTGICCCHIIIL